MHAEVIRVTMFDANENGGRLVMTTRWSSPVSPVHDAILASRESLLRSGSVRGAVTSVGAGLLYVMEGRIARLDALRSVVAGSREEHLERILLNDVGPGLGFQERWPRSPRLTEGERQWAEKLIRIETAPVGMLVALLHWAAARACEQGVAPLSLAGAQDEFPHVRLH